jgi:hypothetical protein
MSLINDALKRARKNQGGPPPGMPPLRPVESGEEDNRVEWILPAVIIFLIVTACFCIGLAAARHTAAKIMNAPEPAATQQVESVPVPILKAPTNTGPQIPAVEPIKVQGIVYDPVRPWAIVDGKTVFIGDSVREFRVKQISKNAVTLEAADGSQQKLGLGQ